MAGTSPPTGSCRIGPASGGLRRHLARLVDGFVDRADHVKGALRQVVVVSGDDALKAFDRVLKVYKDTGGAGEYLGDVEGLRQKALDLAGSSDGQLVFLGQLVHAKNRDDVLQ